MTTSYTTPEKVASLLRLTDGDGIRREFDQVEDPYRTEVEMFINWAEDRMDRYTNGGWRTKTIVDELYSLAQPYHQVYPRWTCVPLKNQDIQQMDHIWVTNSGTEEDWKVTKTEGRTADWYVDKTHGMLYMRRYYPWLMDTNVLRLSYTYGKTVVPKDIEEACTKMAAITIMQNDFNRTTLADGLNYEPSRTSVIHRWNEDVEYILRRNMKYVAIGVL